MDIKRIIREVVSNFNWVGGTLPHLSETNRLNKGDMDWIESINIRYHKMNYDELEEIINKTFEGTRYGVEITNTGFNIIDIKDGGVYIEFHMRHLSIDDIINRVETETKTMGNHVSIGVQEEYRELYEILNNSYPSENIPWTIKEGFDDMGWIKDIKPLDAINQRGQYKIWFGIISEKEQNRILNILYDNGYEWTGFSNARPTMNKIEEGQNFDSLFLYNGIDSLYGKQFPTTNKSISWMGYNMSFPDWEGNNDKNNAYFYKKLMEYTELPKSIFTI